MQKVTTSVAEVDVIITYGEKLKRKIRNNKKRVSVM